MTLNVAVQMDPIAGINIRGDSTFALLLEAQKRGHGIAYYTPDRLALRDARVFATVQPLKVRDQPGDHFTLGEPARTELATFDVVLLRQDPPFDLAYITSTHMLERVHPKTLVVNDPVEVRNAPEKLFVTQFPGLQPPTLITANRAASALRRAVSRSTAARSRSASPTDHHDTSASSHSAASALSRTACDPPPNGDDGNPADTNGSVGWLGSVGSDIGPS